MNAESNLKTIIVKPFESLFEDADLTCKVIYWCKGYLQRGSDFKNKPDVYIALMAHSQSIGGCIVGTLAESHYNLEKEKKPSLTERIFDVCLPSAFIEVCRFSLCHFVYSLRMKKYASRLLILGALGHRQSAGMLDYPTYMVSLPAIAVFFQASMERKFLTEVASYVNMDEVPPQSRCFFDLGPKLYKIHTNKLLHLTK